MSPEGGGGLDFNPPPPPARQLFFFHLWARCAFGGIEGTASPTFLLQRCPSNVLQSRHDGSGSIFTRSWVMFVTGTQPTGGIAPKPANCAPQWTHNGGGVAPFGGRSARALRGPPCVLGELCKGRVCRNGRGGNGWYSNSLGQSGVKLL